MEKAKAKAVIQPGRLRKKNAELKIKNKELTGRFYSINLNFVEG